MRVFAATLTATLMFLASSNAAFAGWSVPRSFGVSRYAMSAVAVDSRGDAAVAWMTQGNPGVGPDFRTSVYVTVRRANGRLSTRRVWSSRDAEAHGVSVVLGAGAVTVAWSSFDRSGTGTVRAAYGPFSGRWPAPRAIGRLAGEPSYPPIPWDQHMAIAPDGEVLLTFNAWNAWSKAGPLGVAVAWRAPGHHFGWPQVLRRAPGGAIPQFDARGTAYLHGYCNGLLLIAPAHTDRFGSTVVLTAKPVLDFTLSLAGTGRGLAAWVRGECSFDAAAGNTPGPVFASVLSAGKFGKPLELTPAAAAAVYSNAVAVPGGGTVTWAIPAGYSASGSGTFSVQIGADGLPGATRQITGGPTALTADGGGDEVFVWPSIWSPGIGLPGIGLPGVGLPDPPFVRPAGGGPDQPAPSRYGQVAVAAPVGRAAALAWNASPTGSGSTMALSVWRP